MVKLTVACRHGCMAHDKILNMVLSSSCSEFNVENKIQSVHDLSIPSKLAFLVFP